ncbi:MAG: FAD-dependent oxidoreductase [Elusimicrobiota bacterium]
MKYAIIGGSAAGVAAIEAIRSQDKTGKIFLISDEMEALYSRCLLSYYLAGAIPEEKLKFRPADFFAKNKVDVFPGNKARKILPGQKKVILNLGNEIDYDALLIATGGRPKKLGMAKENLDGIYKLRNIADARKIFSLLDTTKNAVVLGGGLIGLRAAYALKQQGKEVKIVVKSQEILSRVLGEEPAQIIRQHIEKEGIEVITGRDVAEILGKNRVEGVVLDDKSKLSCQILIIGKGVSPNKEFLADTGLKFNDGVIVDDYLATGVQGVYAAGDVCETKDLITGQRVIKAIWPCAVEQGRIAGLNMAGQKTKYAGALGMNSVEFFGLPAISVGQTNLTENCKELVRKAPKNYRRLIFQGGRLVGATLVGKVEKAGVYGSLIRSKLDLSGWEEKLLADIFNFAKILPLIKENPTVFNKPEYQEFCGVDVKRK